MDGDWYKIYLSVVLSVLIHVMLWATWSYQERKPYMAHCLLLRVRREYAKMMPLDSSWSDLLGMCRAHGLDATQLAFQVNWHGVSILLENSKDWEFFQQRRGHYANDLHVYLASRRSDEGCRCRS